MARFSETFRLNLSPAELDFVDVDTSNDNRLYLDPYAIQIRDDAWSAQCGDAIRSFFNEILDALRNGDDARAGHLLSHLHEPNETFLGESRGKPSGRGVGRDKANDLLDALKRSRAFQTGLISDISEAELFIENIGPDTISDLTTNILRGLLAEYTLEQCKLHGLPTREVGSLGPIWSVARLDWESRPLQLPISNGMPVLLVPKHSVRRGLSLNSQEFWNHHMVAYLQREYLNSQSALVRTFKNGTRYVTKKSVKERAKTIRTIPTIQRTTNSPLDLDISAAFSEYCYAERSMIAPGLLLHVGTPLAIAEATCWSSKTAILPQCRRWLRTTAALKLTTFYSPALMKSRSEVDSETDSAGWKIHQATCSCQRSGLLRRSPTMGIYAAPESARQ
jgi:hypothetical protein